MLFGLGLVVSKDPHPQMSKVEKIYNTLSEFKKTSKHIESDPITTQNGPKACFGIDFAYTHLFAKIHWFVLATSRLQRPAQFVTRGQELIMNRGFMFMQPLIMIQSSIKVKRVSPFFTPEWWCTMRIYLGGSEKFVACCFELHSKMLTDFGQHVHPYKSFAEVKRR